MLELPTRTAYQTAFFVPARYDDAASLAYDHFRARAKDFWGVLGRGHARDHIGILEVSCAIACVSGGAYARDELGGLGSGFRPTPFR
ncbi:MAG: hypothetical protein EBR81_11740 [Proteobacteria bacterium]|nr:hypothetical protein [Pseudomonadota bacterium]